MANYLFKKSIVLGTSQCTDLWHSHARHSTDFGYRLGMSYHKPYDPLPKSVSMPLLPQHAGRLAYPFLVSRVSPQSKTHGPCWPKPSDLYPSRLSYAIMTIPTSDPCPCPCPCPCLLDPCSVTAFMSCSHRP